MNDPATPSVLKLDDRTIGERPEGKTRGLARATLWLLLASLALSIVLAAVAPGSHAPDWAAVPIGLAYLATLAMTVLSAMLQLWCWISPRSRGSLQIDGAGVRVQGAFIAHTIPRGRIEAGWLLRHGDQGEVELQLRNGDVVTTSVRSHAEGLAVLDAAGVDASRRALTMRLGGALVNLGIASLALIPGACVATVVALAAMDVVALPSAAAGFLLFALMTLSVPLALSLFAPPRVQVGNDGVSVHGGFRRWFVSFDQLDAVELRATSVLLRLRDGSVRSIFSAGTGGARLRSLVARIEAGIADARGPRDLSARLTALDRNGRTFEAWTAALRDLVHDRDDYRHTGLTRQEIEAALDDPHASVDRRIGAAFALAQGDPRAASERVRVVVETVANEPARVALERAADGALDEVTVNAATESSGVRVG